MFILYGVHLTQLLSVVVVVVATRVFFSLRQSFHFWLIRVRYKERGRVNGRERECSSAIDWKKVKERLRVDGMGRVQKKRFGVALYAIVALVKAFWREDWVRAEEEIINNN